MSWVIAVSYREFEVSGCRRNRTEWPLLSGPMSRKASVFSDSKIFRDGISPSEMLGTSVRPMIRDQLPLMILQNMQAAFEAIVVLTVVLGVT